MPLTQSQKQTIVKDALTDHIPWDGVDGDGNPTSDTRTLTQLRSEFERRALGGLVQGYRRAQADKALESLDIRDI